MKNLINTACNYLKSVNYAHLALAFVAISLMLVDPSSAQTFAGVTKFLGSIKTFITGTGGTAIAVIGIVGVGIAFLSGRMDWQMAIAIGLGIAIMKAAGTIAASF